MNFRCSSAPLAELGCDGVALGLFSSSWQQQLAALLPAMAAQLQLLLEQREFKAKGGEKHSFSFPGQQPSPGLMVSTTEKIRSTYPNDLR